MDRSFDARNTDEMPELKRLLQQEQNPSEKVLQDILKSKTNGYCVDPEQFDQITSFERWSDNGECDQEVQGQDAGPNQSGHQQSDSLMFPLPLCPTSRKRLAGRRK